MTLANLITLVRILLVPAIVWAMLSNQLMLAAAVFLAAGLSDAVDGAVARYFNQQSELGTVLDPVADKFMLVSVFIILAYLGHLPLWLAILVVSRDMLIISGVLLAVVLDMHVTIRPLWISKANTAAQIILAAWVIFSLAFDINLDMVQLSLIWITGILTASSAVAYIWEGIKLFAMDDQHT